MENCRGDGKGPGVLRRRQNFVEREPILSGYDPAVALHLRNPRTSMIGTESGQRLGNRHDFYERVTSSYNQVELQDKGPWLRASTWHSGGLGRVRVLIQAEPQFPSG